MTWFKKKTTRIHATTISQWQSKLSHKLVNSLEREDQAPRRYFRTASTQQKEPESQVSTRRHYTLATLVQEATTSDHQTQAEYSVHCAEAKLLAGRSCCHKPCISRFKCLQLRLFTHFKLYYFAALKSSFGAAVVLRAARPLLQPTPPPLNMPPHRCGSAWWWW